MTLAIGWLKQIQTLPPGRGGGVVFSGVSAFKSKDTQGVGETGRPNRSPTPPAETRRGENAVPAVWSRPDTSRHPHSPGTGRGSRGPFLALKAWVPMRLRPGGTWRDGRAKASPASQSPGSRRKAPGHWVARPIFRELPVCTPDRRSFLKKTCPVLSCGAG
jgi:hypothetical protein